jgi:hypothetical protein
VACINGGWRMRLVPIPPTSPVGIITNKTPP